MGIKRIRQIKRPLAGHWVGDGFPVHTLFSYHSDAKEISPFLLLDYAGPADFEPTTKRRGIGMHPHRGFETVTVVYQGEVEHKDSAGYAGRIGPDDVQWMTAARGVLHEEMHGRAFSERGGTLEMVQLWVNLPAENKMDAPRYQEIVSGAIPVVTLPNGAGYVRVIAGDFAGTKGIAKTFSPVNLWDMRLHADADITLFTPDGFTAALLVLRGSVAVNGNDTLTEKEIALFEQSGEEISIATSADATLFVLSGQPIDEPIAGYGPFVMNTEEEIRQAIRDFRSGNF